MWALKPAGNLVSILNRGLELYKTIDFTCLFVEPNSKLLDHLCELVETGKLKALVSKNYSLNEAAEALKHIQTQHTKGKMVKVI
ncbi:zinc-binding dehydrogenase [Pontibacter sp. Tf4]|uniref:zinc-binding dehydrogenase n=1 Tax=Pontibacter sp. Tf4 TaxID=2761620 RepID=UPI001C8AE03C|nr:zinc-binding dehydrogenase [Pontibacter sp. Tf4]